MTLQPGDVVIVVRADGLVQFWEQDTPEVLEYLDNVQELSTCQCAHDHCPAEEMPGWRAQLANGTLEQDITCCSGCGVGLSYGTEREKGSKHPLCSRCTWIAYG